MTWTHILKCPFTTKQAGLFASFALVCFTATYTRFAPALHASGRSVVAMTRVGLCVTLCHTHTACALLHRLDG
ncbi:hypothetical protein PF004_g28098 [Phytophthora fragariae]|uniref:Uncharacterized protein n=1 Tax=Phytophthora fragariae TaxID=53985 RepID=A0A6G0MJR2_9STRA|nr:hypothetical protein PF004_g28098 [Phytophthora fragariae]